MKSKKDFSRHFQLLTACSFAIIAQGCGPSFKVQEQEGLTFTALQLKAMDQIIDTRTHLKVNEDSDKGMLADADSSGSFALDEAAAENLDESLFNKDEDLQKALEEMKDKIKNETSEERQTRMEEARKHVLDMIEKLEGEIASTSDETLKAIHQRALEALKRLATLPTTPSGNPLPPEEALGGLPMPSIDPELEARVRKEIEERRKQIEADMNK